MGFSTKTSRVPPLGSQGPEKNMEDFQLTIRGFLVVVVVVVTKKVWGGGVLNFSFKISVFVFSPIRTSCCQFFLVHSFHVFLSSLAKTLRSQPAEG